MMVGLGTIWESIADVMADVSGSISRPGPVTCVVGALPRRGMIVNVSFRLLYLVFDRLLGWLLLLSRTPVPRTSSCSSYATKSPYSAEPTRRPIWTGPTGPCSRPWSGDYPRYCAAIA